MYNVSKMLNEMKGEYEKLLEPISRQIEFVPEEKLRVSQSNGTHTYYTRDRKDSAKTGWKYLAKKEMGRASELAQYEYASKLKKEIDRQIKAINQLTKTVNYQYVANAYKELPIGKKELVRPYLISDEEYAELWMKEEFVPKDFMEGSPEIYSEKGERVRSKSEKIIADKLYSLGIPYKYEAPLYLSGIGKIYPDFTLLNFTERKEMYWEHFGMMDKPEYAEKAVRKISSYEKNGIYPGQNLIITFETSSYPINIKIIEEMIAKTL